MKEITHREMRNHSGELLRDVASGESVLITSRGRPAALVVPPITDELAALVAGGQARVPTAQLSTLRAIRRTHGASTAEILADLRGER